VDAGLLDLFGKNQLVLPGAAQAVGFALVGDFDFVAAAKQRGAVKHLRAGIGPGAVRDGGSAGVAGFGSGEFIMRMILINLDAFVNRGFPLFAFFSTRRRAVLDPRRRQEAEIFTGL
jgi:hypothetical protein